MRQQEQWRQHLAERAFACSVTIVIKKFLNFIIRWHVIGETISDSPVYKVLLDNHFEHL